MPALTHRHQPGAGEREIEQRGFRRAGAHAGRAVDAEGGVRGHGESGCSEQEMASRDVHEINAP